MKKTSGTATVKPDRLTTTILVSFSCGAPGQTYTSTNKIYKGTTTLDPIVSITVAAAAPLAITTTSLPGGTVGTAYSATVVASGGKTPYTWSATTLPTGLTITASSGKISGTPTKAGTYTTVVTVKGATDTSKTRTLLIKITPAPLKITTTSLPDGVVTVHYTTTLMASGGTGTFTWSATGLPTGLTVTASTGKISGTPTETGTFTVMVTVKDTADQTVSKTLSLKIAKALSITTSSLPDGTVGTAYSATLMGSGGETPYSWSATGLPTGLSVTATSGKISGTPTVSGTFTVLVSLSGHTGRTVTATLGLHVAPKPLTITTTSLPDGVVTVHYTTTLMASGGTGTFTWSATGLPTGLTVTASTGKISGTPTETGTFTVMVTVKDTADQTVSKTLSLKIAKALSITTSSLPDGTVGTAYSATLMGSGGETPYSWSATGLPTGLSVTATSGKISGTPTVSGTFTVLVSLSGHTGRTVTATLGLHVAPKPLTITTTSLPDGVVTVHYTTTLMASGGTGTFTWSATGLPTGLTVTASTGKISGTPTETGTFTVKVTVKDTADQTVSKTLSLKIGPSLAITTTSLPGGTVGTAYSATVVASGGETPYTWSATTLPTGLTITASSGKISGTPTKAGTYTVVVSVKGTTGRTVTATFEIKIAKQPLAITTTSLPNGTVTVGYSATLNAVGGTTPYTWSASTLPPGLTITAKGTVTGKAVKITGSPTAAGKYTVKVKVTGKTKATATSTLTITIGTVAPPVKKTGYWMVASDGGIFSFGTARFHGSMGGQPLNKPIVGMAATPTGGGYWEVASDGGIFAFGNATFYGSMGGMPLNEPIVGIAATPTGGGYWEVASDGGIFAFGNATFYGSMGGMPLNEPIVGIAATPTGKGYWEVASDGGIFSFGTATFHGSMGGTPLNKPVVGISATVTGGGYWEVASDGGIFSFGTATFHGSMGGTPLNQPIVGISATTTGGGYWEVASDGGIFSFGTATFQGSMGGIPLNKPVVGMASS